MKLEKVTDKETNVVELEITVPAEEFEQAVQASYKKNIKKMNIPGFRRGKAPRKMVEKMYGASIFYDDAMEAVYPQAYKDAVEEAKIDPVDRADVEVISIDENGFKFKATVTVKPVIEIKNYKGLKVEKPSAEVTDGDLAAELANYQKQQARLLDIEDRPAENGDSVVIDFEGFVDGKAFDGGKADGYTLKLGSGSFIPGFEEQIVGKNIGDAFSVNVKFPEDYTDELKGKDAEFKVKLHAIKKEDLPELDDDFAKDVSEFDTMEEFSADVKKKIGERKEQACEAEIDRQLSVQLADLVEGEIPECMYESEIDYQMQNFDQRLRSQGLDLEHYAQFSGTTVKDMRKMFRDNAEQDVKVRLALEKISELEKVVVDDADVDAEYEKFAKAYGTEVEKLKSDYVTENIKKDVTVRKAYEVVRNAAEVTDAKAEEKKPAAKKPAAKKPAAKKTTAAKAEGEEKKPAAKKPAAKKTTAEKAEGEEKKPAAKKTTAKKTTAAKAEGEEKKPAAKKTTAKKAPAKKADAE